MGGVPAAWPGPHVPQGGVCCLSGETDWWGRESQQQGASRLGAGGPEVGGQAGSPWWLQLPGAKCTPVWLLFELGPSWELGPGPLQLEET